VRGLRYVASDIPCIQFGSQRETGVTKKCLGGKRKIESLNVSKLFGAYRKRESELSPSPKGRSRSERAEGGGGKGERIGNRLKVPDMLRTHNFNLEEAKKKGRGIQ